MKLLSFKRIFISLDKILNTRWNKIIVVVLLTIFYSVLSLSTYGIITSLFFALTTLWLYISVRKYGWLESLLFIGVLPFLLIGAAIAKLSNSTAVSKNPDMQAFSAKASELLLEAINEVYDGKIIDTRVTSSEVYLTVETPYGLRLPVQKIVPVVAGKIHISPSHIHHDDISDRRSYYIFEKAGAREYEAYMKSTRPVETFHEIWERALCRRPGGFSQK